MTLTTNEATLLRAISTSEYNALNGGDGTDPAIIDSFVWCGFDFFPVFPERRTLNGVMSSLSKKGLVSRTKVCCAITKQGFDVLQKLLAEKSNPKSSKESAMTTKTAPKLTVVADNSKSSKEPAVTTKTSKTSKSNAAKEPAVKTTKTASKPAAKNMSAKSAAAQAKNAAKSAAAQAKNAAKAAKVAAEPKQREAVIEDGAKIKVLVTENPKRGKNARRIFDLYLKSKTVGEWRAAMKKASLDLGYLHGDIRRGLISVK